MSRNLISTVRLLLLAILAILLTACSKPSPVVGTWTSTQGSANGAAALTFSSDGTFEAQNPGSTSGLFSGTWELKNNAVLLTVDHMGGKELPADTEQSLTGYLSVDLKKMMVGRTVFNKSSSG